MTPELFENILAFAGFVGFVVFLAAMFWRVRGSRVEAEAECEAMAERLARKAADLQQAAAAAKVESGNGREAG